MHRIVTPIVVALVVVNGPLAAQAGPLLDRARELAASSAPVRLPGVQQTGCDPAVVASALNDASRVGTGGFLAGGLLLPVIMPLIADGSASNPPFAVTSGMAPEEARCYSAAWSEDVRQRKVSSAWRGTWIGLGTYVGLTVLVLATAPDYPDYR